MSRMIGSLIRTGALLALLSAAAAVQAESICDPDGQQDSGSIYRICMPSSGYNGMLIVWAHGFQDAGTPVSIPEDQLCISGFCLAEVANDLGFAFATNSYSKTGLAVVQGRADILDLVQIFARQKGPPRKVYLVGASEGGLITALNIERHPGVFSAGVAACGPVGTFQFQIGYLGDARATFEYFFPGLIPGSPFDPDPAIAATWPDYYEQVIRPAIFDPANRRQLNQWVRVARLPFDPGDYLGSVDVSARDVLRYTIVNLRDAAETLGGFPFGNRSRWYVGSDNDLLLNLGVPRISADSAAVSRMKADYTTSGVLRRPLITMHTLKDQQVPYAHERIYNLKTLASAALLTRHLNIPVNRFEHCNFTVDEALFSLAVMLLYDGILDEVTGTAAFLGSAELAAFERRAKSAGLPNRREGASLAFRLRQP